MGREPEPGPTRPGLGERQALAGGSVARRQSFRACSTERNPRKSVTVSETAQESPIGPGRSWGLARSGMGTVSLSGILCPKPRGANWLATGTPGIRARTNQRGRSISVKG
jgi:hypothetical protein